jgi:hypothetical protein
MIFKINIFYDFILFQFYIVLYLIFIILIDIFLIYSSTLN